MNTEKLKQQIAELQETLKLAEAKEQANSQKLTFRKFKCLPNIKVSNIIKWDKPYNQIVISKGLRLISAQEIITILESDEEYEFLGEFKNIYNYFWLAQTKWDKKNAGAHWLYRNDGGSWDADRDSLDYSDVAGRVVFVKDNGK